jgi:hypothetical protein
VLYLLHGMFGSHEDWTANSDIERLEVLRNGAVALAHRMIKAGLSSEVLEVRSPVVAAELGVCRVPVSA